jgi:hypothetical protein
MYSKNWPRPYILHAYILLKLTMNWTHWNTFYTWCMQYPYDTPFLIIVQHSVQVNVDVWLTVFQLFHTRLICIKPAQAVCRTIWILNDVRQWTGTPSILLRTQNMWHMSWVWVAGPLVVTSKCIKVCVIIYNLYYEIVTQIHVTMNDNQVKKLKLVNVYWSSIDNFTKIWSLPWW